MAKKDFDAYFYDVCNQYHELTLELKELEDACTSSVVDPTIISNMEAMIEPLKNNYMTLSYIKFLLDKPIKKSKMTKYTKSNKKLLEISNGRTQADIHAENSEVLHNLKSLTNSLQNRG